MEFYYTYVCPKCCENRDNNGLKTIKPAKCRVCGKKVIAVKIYLDYLEDHNLSKNKESAKLEASMEKDSTPNKPSEEICSLCKYEGQVGFCEQCGINYVSTCQFESKLSHIG